MSPAPTLYVPANHQHLLLIADGAKMAHLRSVIFCTEDAVADRDQTVHDVFLRRFQESCGDVLPTAEIVKIWSGAPSELTKTRQ